MRISVEIDEGILKQAMELTGDSKRSGALAKAATAFVRREKAREFGRLLREGAFDYPTVLDEIGADPGNPVPPLMED